MTTDKIVANNNTAGIYIHIPFCKKACSYCNFHFSTSLKIKDELVLAICKELETQKSYLQNKPIETIYLGGGTPSLLSMKNLEDIFKTISANYDLKLLKEITIEVNPDDIKPEYLKQLKSLPINRLSIGIQSFFDDDLALMNRSHNSKQAENAIKYSQDEGFENLTIDLIYGTPGLTHEKWLQNLNKTIIFSIPHFSAYALTVENKTLLNHQINKHIIPAPSAELASIQFENLIQFVQNNQYEHYEISNFSLPGNHARHNTNYWMGNHYLGIGPSAHSFNGVSRKWNINNNSLYCSSLLKKNVLLFDEELLTPTQQINEYILTSLRTKWGCNLNYIQIKWGVKIVNTICKSTEKYILSGHLEKLNDIINLTNKGKLFADRITIDLMLT